MGWWPDGRTDGQKEWDPARVQGMLSCPFCPPVPHTTRSHHPELYMRPAVELSTRDTVPWLQTWGAPAAQHGALVTSKQ